MQAVILVVEDEPQMSEIITYVLDKHGYGVLATESAQAAWRMLQQRTVDAIVLDVMLPDMTGIELCRQLRTQFSTPILMLSALAEVEHRIDGLEAGADDYLGKPFSPAELALRIERLLSRSSGANGAQEWASAGPIAVHRHQPVARVFNRRIELTRTECAVLRVLVDADGDTVSAARLLRVVWGRTSSLSSSQLVKTTMYRLRHQLGPDGAALIRSVRGKGYAITR